jgi:hypothetical protein
MDQKIVELALEFFYFAQAPDLFWEKLPGVCQSALIRMADLALDHFTLSINNWNLFPVMAQAGLHRLGLPWDRPSVDSLLTEYDAMYQGEGWFADGYHRQFDYYVAWEMQAFGLLVANWFQDEWPERWEIAAERAVQFSQSYDFYFDRTGRHIPYGRSLAYRYSAATFWGMAAWLQVPGLDASKSLLKAHANILAISRLSRHMGVSDLGFTYHQPLLPEPYIAAGSALGSNAFQVLAFPENHPIWNQLAGDSPFTQDATRVERVPNLILSRQDDGRNAILFNQGSMHPLDFGNHPAKYSKFAYSSHFGFNLATPAISSFDNMISLSRDGGVWSHRFQFQPLPGQGDWVLSRHAPFPDQPDVQVVSALTVHGNWHVRFHEIRNPGDPLQVREAGFPIDSSECSCSEVSGSDVEIRGANGSCRVVGVLGEWVGEISGIHPNMNLYSRYAMVPFVHGSLHCSIQYVAVAIHCQVLPGLRDRQACPALVGSPAMGWSVKWPDGCLSSVVSFCDLPDFKLPGRKGKPWSRPCVFAS